MTFDPALEPVVFGAAIDGMRKALGKRFTPELKSTLLKAGIDFDKVLPAYSLESWILVVRTLGDALAADAAPDDRYQSLGRLFMQGFVQTPIGFAALAAGKLLGVKRTLLRMGRNFRTASNYIETECTQVGLNDLRIRTFIAEKFRPRVTDRSTLMAEYRQGVLQEVLVLVGGKGTVEIVDVKPELHDVTYRIAWQ
jgi:uncharacterized protein (TIGR02265 family)